MAALVAPAPRQGYGGVYGVVVYGRGAEPAADTAAGVGSPPGVARAQASSITNNNWQFKDNYLGTRGGRNR